MARRRIVGGLDVGTTKVCTCIGELTADGAVAIIGVGVSPSHGLRRGVVVDLEATGRAIQESVAAAERMAGLSLESVYVGVSGTHVSSLNSSGVIAIAGAKGEITAEDAQRVLQAARTVKLPQDRELLHVLPREFIVDGYKGIRDPVGMTGVRLEAVVHIVTAAVAHTQNLLKAVQRAGLEVAGLVLPTLAVAEAVLEPAEREMGVALVDIGGGTTDVAVFIDGRVAHTAVVPVSAHHITNDIAVGLQIPVAQAEEIKLQHGTALREVAATRQPGAAKAAGGRLSLADIITPRIEELFQMVRGEIERSTGGERLPGGVVLTGGGALMDGMLAAAQEHLGLPARLGVPGGVVGLVDVVNSPIYSAAVGLMRYGFAQAGPAPAASANGAPWRRLMERLKQWLSEML
ncbi:MAG TPA: cell division protein FtsA [Limnochordales bacterium]